MSDRKEFRDLATPEAAREAIDDLDLAGAGDSPPEDARGRVLAERIDAAIDVPGFDRASMDGYAVRARATPSAPTRPIRPTSTSSGRSTLARRPRSPSSPAPAPRYPPGP